MRLTMPQYEHIEVRSFRGLLGVPLEEDTLAPPAALPPAPVSSLLVAMVLISVLSNVVLNERGRALSPAQLISAG